jgi:hypothetical protein
MTRIGFADPAFVKNLAGRPIQVVVLKEIKAYRFALFSWRSRMINLFFDSEEQGI